MKTKKKILITPLNWGLGHATRCIPIIRLLLEKGCEVQIASDGDALLLLQKEFPAIKTWTLTSYKINYDNHFVWSMAKSIPSILQAINAEKEEVKEIAAMENIDIIISDNRYGCFTSMTQNIFVCHQHQLLLPTWMKPLQYPINWIHNQKLKQFQTHWIPDEENRFLSGELSATHIPNAQFIGPLSRFVPSKQKKEYDVIAIVSGPEPQRTTFFNLLKGQLTKSEHKSLLVGGRPSSDSQTNEQIDHCTIISFLDSRQLEKAIQSSDRVICRSGYSTIMDLAALGKKALFVPTPGQTEQEYLAAKFQANQIAPFQIQSHLNIELGLQETEKHTGFTPTFSTNQLLDTQISKLLNS